MKKELNQEISMQLKDNANLVLEKVVLVTISDTPTVEPVRQSSLMLIKSL